MILEAKNKPPFIHFGFNQIAKTIIEKIQGSSEIVAKYTTGKCPVYYKNTGVGYFIASTLLPPECVINGKQTSSSRETTINFENNDLRNIFHSIIVSSTFFLYYHARSNCRDLNPSDITTFHFPKSLLTETRLIHLSEKLQDNLVKTSWFQTRNQKQTGEVKIQSFTVSLSKDIIDEIDKVLAEYFKFSSEELDFVMNYDIKYRMGKELEGDEEE